MSDRINIAELRSAALRCEGRAIVPLAPSQLFALVEAVEAAHRLKEGERIDAKMGYPLPGDCALAVYLLTLDERLSRFDFGDEA